MVLLHVSGMLLLLIDRYDLIGCMLGSQLSISLYFAIAAAIVGSHSGCSCCCGVPVAVGGRPPWCKDVDIGRADVVVDDKGLLRETNKLNELDYNCN